MSRYRRLSSSNRGVSSGEWKCLGFATPCWLHGLSCRAYSAAEEAWWHYMADVRDTADAGSFFWPRNDTSRPAKQTACVPDGLLFPCSHDDNCPAYLRLRPLHMQSFSTSSASGPCAFSLRTEHLCRLLSLVSAGRAPAALDSNPYDIHTAVLFLPAVGLRSTWPIVAYMI